MRFTLVLYFSLRSAWSRVDFEDFGSIACISPKSSDQNSCSNQNNPFGCKLCAGLSSCCLDSNSYYGACYDSNISNCPNGDKALCSPGNCPLALSCNYVNCPEVADLCWGSTVCDDETICSNLDGLFCSGEKSNPQNFSVCCSSKIEANIECYGETQGSSSAYNLVLTSEGEKNISDNPEIAIYDSTSIAQVRTSGNHLQFLFDSARSNFVYVPILAEH